MRTLYAKLALTLTVLLISVGLVYAFVSHSLSARYQAHATQWVNRNLAANLVADEALVDGDQLDHDALAATFNRFMIINPNIEIYLLDERGDIVAYSADPDQVKRQSVGLEPIERFLSGTGDYPILGDDPRHPSGRKSFSVTRVPSGYLYVVLRASDYDTLGAVQNLQWFLRTSAWVVGGSLLVGLIIGLLSFAWLTRRLRRLTDSMQAFAASGFEQAPEITTPARHGDEIDQLSEHYALMGQRIGALVAELRQIDAARREMINNISHDLRTPLTCLHAYLETLHGKHDQLDETERREYLDAALRHSKHLSRMVEALFELARLDARIVALHRERFSIAELLQDLVQKYRLLAARRKIRLSARLPASTPMVEADLGMIDRVLENLIGNALAYTPSGERIVIDLRCRNDAVWITVLNTGTGIEPNETSALFERFRRGSGAQRDDEHHLGLGLAIAQRIVELHGGSIRAGGQPKKRTWFQFPLPIASA